MPEDGAGKKPAAESCPNCGTILAANVRYCSDCGQEQRDLRVPFRRFAGEALEGLFHIDAKAFRTLRALMLHPGALTVEYLTGRRRRYVAPVRLYITISVLFFFLAAVANPAGGSGTVQRDQTRLSGPGFSISFQSLPMKDLRNRTDAEIDSLMRLHAIGSGRINRYIVRQLARIADEGTEPFLHLFLRNCSYAMFVLMPFFAFLLHLFLRKEGLYYSESLIASVHFHSFGFAAGGLAILLSIFIPGIVVLPLYWLAAGWYLYRSVAVVYRVRKVRAFISTIVLLPVYFFIAIFVLMMLIFISIILV
ncbi:MAG TPA: DUF3667 domain-containing protein [Bacteroidota bacterium]|nr:DUF3667 domain-containing protein [Bacteroidota bacterium]